VNYRSVMVGALLSALFAGVVYKYIEDERSARLPREGYVPYTAPIANDKRPFYQQTRSTGHIEATAKTVSNGVISGASFFANDYCPDLSKTGRLARLRQSANGVAEDKEYSRLVTEIHAAPHSIDALCKALLAKYPDYLYVSKVSRKWVSNNLRSPHMFGLQNDWKIGRYSTATEDHP
jgi:hypothetical protein